MTAVACPPHWFLVAAQNGPTSRGRCKKCGETREFTNTPANTYFYGTRNQNRAKVKEAKEALALKSREEAKCH